MSNVDKKGQEKERICKKFSTRILRNYMKVIPYSSNDKNIKKYDQRDGSGIFGDKSERLSLGDVSQCNRFFKMTEVGNSAGSIICLK